MHERPHDAQYVRQMRPRYLSDKLTFEALSNCEYEFVVQYVSMHRQPFMNKKSWLYTTSPNNDKHIKAINSYHYILLIFPNLLYTELRTISGILSTPS